LKKLKNSVFLDSYKLAQSMQSFPSNRRIRKQHMKKILGITLTGALAAAAWILPTSEAGACSCPAYEPENAFITSVSMVVPGDDAELLAREQERWEAVSQVEAEGGLQLLGWKELDWGTRYTTISFAPLEENDTDLESEEGGAQ
jgi:hypothetical protein